MVTRRIRHEEQSASGSTLPGASVIGRGIYVRPRKPYELKDGIFQLRRDGGQLYSSWEDAYSCWQGGRRYRVPGNCVVNFSPPAPANQSLGETVIEESWDRFGHEVTLNASAAVSSNLINS